MWKLEGQTLINKGNVWKSQGKWIFTPKSPPNYEIINLEGKTIQVPDPNNKTKMVDTFVRTVLSKADNDSVIEIEDSNTGKIWKKGNVDMNGYFTLSQPSSEKFITANSAKELALRGKAYRTVFP